ncbi:uncharacterized protein LOC106180636 [Lingula anatina]|uniref:Uncharacterized protein LOC106180636 n=1 Tax=Lingula anatina TaxID=7574 RepID=A0A1S3KCG0_LINAN|nr:uncharacterized protein LOC106180636 [Lingula anatina]|eukprot:XP_013420124.1 uncharacterized protein LOC106180636 [Lingula anatina]
MKGFVFMLPLCMMFAMFAKVESASNKCMGIQMDIGTGMNIKRSPVIPPLSPSCQNKLKNAGIIPSMPMCPKGNGCTVTYKAVTSIRLSGGKRCTVVCPHVLHYPKVECDDHEKCPGNKKCQRDDDRYTKTYRILAKCPGETILLVSNQATCCDCLSSFFLDFSSLFSLGKK